VEKSTVLHISYAGFHSHQGTPVAGWFTMENPIKNGRFGGATILGNIHMRISAETIHSYIATPEIHHLAFN
jgi:hypothetical protein